MRFAELAKTVEKFSIDNSPTILTAVGVAGTISAAVLAGKAGFKAAEILEMEKAKEASRGNALQLTRKDAFKQTWTLYIPAAGAVVLSCGAIIGANQISTRRAAAIASAYAISEKAWTEYREKVIERLGENKDREVRDSVAQDRVTRTSEASREVIIASGKSLFMDSYSGRFFESTIEEVKAAQNKVNYQMMHDCYASLSDLYDWLGLEKTTMSDEIGWDGQKMLEFEFSATITEDGRPCIVLNYGVVPIRDYWRMH